MCDGWADDFLTFYRDMGDCPPGLTLERDDFNRDYEPGNCRWATQAEQVRNTSRNVLVDMGGVQMILKDYAALRGVGYHGMQYRMKFLGQGPHEAAEAMIERQRRRQSTAAAA